MDTHSASSSAPENQATEILIAGAGPVGMTLALALAERDFSVTIADRAPLSASASRVDPRAYLIAAGCWRIFGRLGLGEALAPDAEPVLSIEAHGGGGGVEFLNDDADLEGPLGYMIEAVKLEAVLAQAVRAASGIRVVAPADMKDVAFGDAGVTARIGDETISARLLAACDGKRSQARRSAGIRYEGHDYKACAVSAVLKPELPHKGCARQLFLPTGPIAALPMTQGRVNLVWSVPANIGEALLALDDAGFEAELQKQAPGLLPGARLMGPRQSFPLGLRVAESFHANRLALAGDAAHLVHPLAGQGLNLGLKDVAALVDVIVEADRAGSDFGGAAALAAYTRWRRGDTLSTAAAMDGFHHIFRAPAPVRFIAGAAMSLAGAVAPMRRAFAKDACAVAGETPSLMQVD